MLTVWQFDPAQTTAYYNAALCNALAQAGCHVRYITSRYLYEDTLPLSADIQVEYAYKLGLPRAWLRDLRWLRRGLRALTYPLGHWLTVREAQRNQPDIFHMQWSRWPLLDRWLMRQFRRLQIPVVYTVHEVIPLFAPGARHSYEPIYAAADRLIVHSQAARAAFQKVFPNIAPEKLRTLPLISAPNQNTPDHASRGAARHSLNLPDEARVILFFGTLRPYKGLARLVEAFQSVQRSLPDLWLLVAGRPESPQDAAPLKALEGHPHVQAHLTFIPSEAMWQYFLAADVAVFPYEQVYQSAALIDALGFECPVIVTDVGGLSEAVDGNGWVVPQGDTEALSRTIIEAVSDPVRLGRMSARSRQLFRQVYTSTAIAAQTLELYQDCLARNPL